MDNRPRSREKNVTGSSDGVNRRGSGLGTGPVGSGRPPVGNGNRPPVGGRPPVKGPRENNNGGGSKRGGAPIILIIIILVIVFGAGKGLFSSLGGSDKPADTSAYTQTQNESQTYQKPQTTSAPVNTSVAEGSREKYTDILGNGKDQVTVMIYMCGTDLESKSGMATKDLKEMAKASYGDNVNVIVYTGGAKEWKINGISNRRNQIYLVKEGGLIPLEDDMGSLAMTDPDNLTEFILYCKDNFPANRNELILWDHGGGSISGYGYDEKYPSSGSMTITKIDKALDKAGVKFDFIGFDACLMACAENALMLDEHGDYMIASEETEPGIGWYYTPWLNALGSNTSIDTVSLGKEIIDGFVDECSYKCRGQKATLSIIDLAEFSATVPEKLKAFSSDTAEMIQNDEYQRVAVARAEAREFATSSKIDQVDLVDLANRIGADSSKELINAVRSAVKYNRTCSSINNAYGVSIYFPNSKLNYVDTVVAMNNAIGMKEEYNTCIKEFAQVRLSGQAVSQGMGNTGSAFSVLGGGGSQSSIAGADDVFSLITGLLGGMDFFSDRSLSDEYTADYIYDNQFDPYYIDWTAGDNNQAVIDLPASQWRLITDVVMNMFFDDGEGYVDLGCDNVFSYDSKGRLVPETDRSWLAINGQPVAYYYEGITEDGDDYSISGYIPALLNGVRVNLIVVFDQDNPYGYIAGANTVYKNAETETVAKNEIELAEGDIIQCLCDFYTYDGRYEDSFFIGDPIEVTDDLEISNVVIGGGEVLITYKFTDIYNNNYWTSPLSY